jgi:hypothetical protein
MEPTVLFPPATPSTVQITPVFELPVTVAAYCDELPKVMLVAPVRTSVTPGPLGGTGAAVSATATPSETDGSATLLAVIVTFAG